MKATVKQIEKAIDSAEPVGVDETKEQFKSRVFKNLSLICGCFFTARQADTLDAEIEKNIAGWDVFN